MDNWDDLSPAGQIKWLLSAGGDTRWGWVIYRCIYAPELATHWETFKRLVNEKTRQVVAQSDAPEVVDQLEWVFIDQDTALEGASLDELKHRFRVWAREENQNPDYDIDHVPIGVSRGSRYTYFIRVDEEALRSLLVDGGPGDSTARVSLERGYVGIVRGWHGSPPTTDEARGHHGGDEIDNEDWMKIKASLLVTPELYVDLDNDEAWYARYSPPPHGICVS